MKTAEELRIQFREQITRGDFQSLEALWMEAIEQTTNGAPPEVAVFIEAADGLIQATQLDRAGVLLDLTTTVFEKQDQRCARDLLELARRQSLVNPASGDARQRFVALWREVHGVISLEALYLELVNLEKATDLRKAFLELDRFLKFREGTYVYHPAGWGTGQVTSIDPTLRQATVNLEKKPNHRVAIEALKAIFEPLADDHLLVLRLKGGDKLMEMRDSDPLALVDTVLRSYGNPLELKGIKSHLIPLVIPSDDWSKWWTRVKKMLRSSGYYRVQDVSPFAIERVEQAISYEDDLLKKYQRSDWNERRSLIKKALKEKGRVQPKLLEFIQSDLQKILAEAKGTQALEAAILIGRIDTGSGGKAAEAMLAAALKASQNLIADVCQIDGGEEQRLAVAALPAVLRDRWEDAAISLLNAGSDSIRDAVTELAREASLRERITHRISEVMRMPRSTPDLFVWAVKRKTETPGGEMFKSFLELDAVQLFELVMDLLDHLARKGEREGKELTKDSLARMRNLFGARSLDILRQSLKDVDRVKGRLIYERILATAGLTEALRIEALDVLTRTIPDVTRPPDVPIWEENCIYVTEGGLKKRQEELREIMDVKLPENFRDIGRAASFGDLSENAEYTAALETRDFLTKKATEIRSELDQTRLITKAMLKDGEVTLGTKVTIINLKSNKNHVYRILGPWDGSPDNGVISYRSPLGRVFLGLRVNNEVNVQLPAGKESYRILSIEPGI